MSISVDSSWARATQDGGASNNVDTGSKTPAAGTLLVAVFSTNTNGGENVTPTVSTLTGTSGAWTKRVESPATTGDGNTSIWTAVADGSAITVRGTSNTAQGTKFQSIKIYIVSGQHASAPIGANALGVSTTNNLTTTAYVSTADNSRGFVGGTEWNDLGTPVSSDTTLDTFYDGSAGDDLCGCSGVKAADTATSGSNVTFNLDAAGSGAADWTWAALEILPDAGAGAGIAIPVLTRQYRQRWS